MAQIRPTVRQRRELGTGYGIVGLDWQVLKTQNYARNPQGKVVAVSSYSVFRDIDGAELASNVGATGSDQLMTPQNQPLAELEK